MELFVSIIMPVYNSERFLKESILSILKQTHSNFELIIINDGSTDRSLEIINGMAKLDSRIVIFDKVNEGVSKAIKDGINISKYNYLSFIDSDDLVTENMIQIMVERMKIDNSDIVECSVNRIDENSNFLNIDVCYNDEILNKKMDGFNCAIEVLRLNKKANGSMGYRCNKLYKKEVLTSKYLDFELGLCDDHLMVVPAFILSKTISRVSDCLYLYRVSSDQFTNSFSSNRRKNTIEYIKALESFYNDFLIEEKYLSLRNEENINTLRKAIDVSYVKRRYEVIFNDLNIIGVRNIKKSNFYVSKYAKYSKYKFNINDINYLNDIKYICPFGFAILIFILKKFKKATFV